MKPMTDSEAIAYIEGLADQEAKAADDAILADILRRLLAEPLDVGLYRAAGAYKLWTRHEATLSNEEAAVVRRVLEQ